MPVIKFNISSVVEGVWQKIINGIGRGPSEQIVNRSYFQHAGFTSKPKVNSVGIAIVDNDNITTIATTEHEDDRYVLQGNDYAAIYSGSDKYIKLDTDGKIEASNGNGKLILKANGDIALGEGVLSALMTESFINKFLTHIHPVSGAVTLVPNPTVPPVSIAADTTQNTKAL